MKCNSIKEKLSAYMEDQLSSGEKTRVVEHLKTCEKCSLFLEDLKKTVAYARGLEEVEPPPWLTQKVMARVREETGQKKGILQKLFYPLHIKVPLEVIATIAVAVSAFYVFKTIQPEMKVVQKPSEQVKSLPKALEPAKRQRLDREMDVIAGKIETDEDSPALAGEKAVPRKTYRALDMKMKKESKVHIPEEEQALFQDVKEDVVLTLYVKDIENGAGKTEEVIKGLGGEVIQKESFEDKLTLLSKLDSQKMERLFERLRLVGDVKEKDALYSLKVDATYRGRFSGSSRTDVPRFRGDVIIRIKIVKMSE